MIYFQNNKFNIVSADEIFTCEHENLNKYYTPNNQNSFKWIMRTNERAQENTQGKSGGTSEFLGCNNKSINNTREGFFFFY